jgi:hypothetical protein
MFGALRVVAFHSHPFINRHPYFGRLIAILLSKAQLVYNGGRPVKTSLRLKAFRTLSG